MLRPGLHCRACDSPLDGIGDPELCNACMAVVFDYNRSLLEDEDMDLTELLDIENLLGEEYNEL